jgi:hypothetical protein
MRFGCCARRKFVCRATHLRATNEMRGATHHFVWKGMRPPYWLSERAVLGSGVSGPLLIGLRANGVAGGGAARECIRTQETNKHANVSGSYFARKDMKMLRASNTAASCNRSLFKHSIRRVALRESKRTHKPRYVLKVLRPTITTTQHHQTEKGEPRGSTWRSDYAKDGKKDACHTQTKPCALRKPIVRTPQSTS